MFVKLLFKTSFQEDSYSKVFNYTSQNALLGELSSKKLMMEDLENILVKTRLLLCLLKKIISSRK